jgi:hypothetical protein
MRCEVFNNALRCTALHPSGSLQPIMQRILSCTPPACNESCNSFWKQIEGPNYVIRDGIVVIPRGTAVPDGTVI